MNCSAINILLNTCLKADIYCKRKLQSDIYRNQIFLTQKWGCKSICYRYFQTSQKSVQSLKDGITSPPSPQEVTSILCKNEFNKEFESGCVKSYDSNQLASNNPIEDTRSEALCTKTKGMLMGVFDGHGGPACAQVLSKRLLNYVAATLLPADVLTKYIKDGANESLLESYNDRAEIVEDLKPIYEGNFKQYITELALSPKPVNDVKTALEQAILKLDSDLSREVVEAFDKKSNIHPKILSVALSGAVACVCHIDGPHLHVANVGDCNAVLGTLTEENEWIAKKITKEHNAENFDELKRIWNEHPEQERKTVIRRDRLLGELAPLRSLGDYRYKWTAELLNKLAVPYVGTRAIPPNYHTPPYLSAAPEIFYHRLTPKEKFLIIASDGLWDMLTPLQAVKLVGEHMKGKVFFNPLKLPRKSIQLGDLEELLAHRKESLKSKPKDRNAATHLIRHAIGGTEYGVDHSRLAHLLSLSSDVSRMFRDDITVTIAYFDSEFIRQCPS